MSQNTLPVSELGRSPGWWLDSDLLYAFFRSPLAIGAALITLLLIIAAVAAPIIAPHDPFDIKSLNLLESHLPPAWANEGNPRYWLGTDDQGRDILSAILYGSRISLFVGVLSVLFAATIGVGLGLIAGYAGGA